MYTLLNKRLNRKLEHPEYGIWTTPDIKQADEMLRACREYLVASELSHLFNDFVIIDNDTEEEVVVVES
jgi:hypothetical protein